MHLRRAAGGSSRLHGLRLTSGEASDRASVVDQHHRGGVVLGDDGSEAAKAAGAALVRQRPVTAGGAGADAGRRHDQPAEPDLRLTPVGALARRLGGSGDRDQRRVRRRSLQPIAPSCPIVADRPPSPPNSTWLPSATRTPSAHHRDRRADTIRRARSARENSFENIHGVRLVQIVQLGGRFVAV